MRNLFAVLVLCTSVAIGLQNATGLTAQAGDQASASPEIRQTPTATPDPGLDPALPPDQLARQATAVRLETDLAAMQHFSPSYPFWYHVFTVPDGSVAFGKGIITIT